MKSKLYLAATVSAVVGVVTTANALPFSDPRAEHIEAMDKAGANESRDPACRANTFVSAGGMFPRNPHTLALRWGGFANYELVYNGKIILLDAYYDRGSYYQPVGVKAADIKRADVLLLGHGHSDHMSDAAQIGRQTGAMVVGAPVRPRSSRPNGFRRVRSKPSPERAEKCSPLRASPSSRSLAVTARPTAAPRR